MNMQMWAILTDCAKYRVEKTEIDDRTHTTYKKLRLVEKKPNTEATLTLMCFLFKSYKMEACLRFARSLIHAFLNQWVVGQKWVTKLF